SVVPLDPGEQVGAGLLAGLVAVEQHNRAVVALGAVRTRRLAVLGLVVLRERATRLGGRQTRAGDDRAVGGVTGTLREAGVVEAVEAQELGRDTRGAHLLDQRRGLVGVHAVRAHVRRRRLDLRDGGVEVGLVGLDLVRVDDRRAEALLDLVHDAATTGLAVVD